MMKVNTSLWRQLSGALLVLAALAGASGPAQGAPQPPRELRRAFRSFNEADTATVPPLPADAAAQLPVRRPAAARLQELRSQREFQYVEGTPAEAGFWERLQAWFWQRLAELLQTKGGRTSWNIFIYVAIAAILVFAVLKLLQVDLTKVFGRATRRLPLAYEAGQENIHELDFADAIAQAEAAGNLRLAVRLGYLQLLKQLTDRNLIDWQPDKTNQTYLRELAASRPAARPAFAEVTRQFEYIWYGELPLPAALHQQVREAQRQFGQQLSGAGRRAQAV